MKVKTKYHSVAVRCTEYPRFSWVQPTGELFHQREGAHIWLIDTKDFTKSQIGHFWKKLSFGEQEKALRFHFEKDRERYVLTHGILREMMGEYLGCEGANLFFEKNKNGKPFLSGGRNLEFNISHSGDLILLAFRFCENEQQTLQPQIGIDVEKIKSDFDFELVLDSFFTEKEKDEIWNSESAVETFFKYWTRKEALVKATGTGLTNELKRIDLSQKRNELKMGEQKFSKFLSQQLYIHSFEINLINKQNYAGSIALMESDVRLQFFKYKS